LGAKKKNTKEGKKKTDQLEGLKDQSSQQRWGSKLEKSPSQ